MYNDLEYKNKIVVGLIMTFALLFFCAGVSVHQYFLPVVTLQVNSVTIRQDDALPELEIYAKYNGEQNIVLDESSGYSINQLVNDLNHGNGYQLVNGIDNTKEGTYDLTLDLVQELKKKFVYSWNQKVRYRIVSGTVNVLNKYGDWEDGRFKLLDGNYAVGWTNLGQDTYYFDESGVRVTVIGAGITWTVIKSIEMLGPAKSALLIVVAQLLVSYLIELFGMFGMDKEPFEWRKIIGMVVAAVGITIFQWK